MTRAIAFASALLLLPLLYADGYLTQNGNTVLEALLHDPRGLMFDIVFGFGISFTLGHIGWLACRAFNRVMRALA